MKRNAKDKAKGSGKNTAADKPAETVKNVKASIVIPVHNTEKYLRECLDSAVSQTLRDIEIICVDDGSTDSSMNILREYADKDDRIRIVEQKNRGGGAARNNGLSHACGEYVFFLDSDDMCAPNLLEVTVAAAEKERADIVCFDYEKLDLTGERKPFKGYHKYELPQNVTVFNYLICPTRILTVINPTPWTKLFLRSFLIDSQLRYEEISSTNDITFSAVSCAMASRIVAVEKTLYTYRIGHSQTTSSTKVKNIKNVCIAVESTIRQVMRLPYYDIIKDSLARFVVDNYLFSLTHYVPDITTPEAKYFYETMYETFNRPEFAGLSVEQLGYLHRRYRVVRENPYEEYVYHSGKKIIVSLTSYPARINCVRIVLDTIYLQTKQPNEVVLYLAEDQFPRKELDLPYSVMELVLSEKLRVKWCRDLKPHKKYLYAFKDYPDDLIITIDDDLLQPKDLVENLYITYMLNHRSVCASRVHLMTIDSKEKILPYRYWIKEYNNCLEKPSMQLLCTGGAGALYPVELFKDNPLLNEQAIIDNCLLADDIWLKFVQLVSNVPVVLAGKYDGIRYVPGSQEEALYKTNIEKNDDQLQNCIQYVDKLYGEGFAFQQLAQTTDGCSLFNTETICAFYTEELETKNEKIRCAFNDANKLRKLEKEVVRLRTSYAYRIGRVITFPLRKLKFPERMLKGIIKKMKKKWGKGSSR